MSKTPESHQPFSPEPWPADEHVPIAAIASRYVRMYRDQVVDTDRIGVVTVGPHLVPLLDSVFGTIMRETAGQGTDVIVRFGYIDEEKQQKGAKLGVSYYGPGPLPEAFEDPATEFGRLRQEAITAGGNLEHTEDERGAPYIVLTFPFWPNQT